MQKYYKNISWETYNLPQALKKRGIDVVDKLPNFYYRDDSLKLWTAIEGFVKQILDIYYRSIYYRTIADINSVTFPEFFI